MGHWSDGTKLFPWYDSAWLGAYETVKLRLLERDRALLSSFERAFDGLRTDPGFRVKSLEAPLSIGNLEALREHCRSLTLERLERHELGEFGRLVAHDLPLVTEIHHGLSPLVSRLAGEEVEPTYNFLSLYHGGGSLPPHLDDPQAKFTLDVCLDSNVDWPIFVSEPVAWPCAGDFSGEGWEERVKSSAQFSSHVIRPGSGILFSGSAQWHYRNAFPGSGAGDYCDLVFFHFRPKGSGKLTDPSEWPALFGRDDLFPGA